MDKWLFPSASAKQVAALRIGLSALLLARLMRSDFVALSRLPEESFRPISFMLLLDKMPPTGVVIALQALGLLAGVAALIGWHARKSLPIAWAASMILSGMATSSGKIMHNDSLLLLCVIPLLFAPHDHAWSIRPSGPETEETWRYGFPRRAALILVSGAYFFAGLAKLVTAGPAWVTSGNMRWILYAASDAQAHPNAAALAIADRPWLASLSAGMIIALELAFPLALINGRMRGLLGSGAVMFSLGIGLTMRLNYLVWAGVVVVTLVDWPPLILRVDRWRSGRARPAPVGDFLES